MMIEKRITFGGRRGEEREGRREERRERETEA